MKSLKILVVDDSEQQLEAAKKQLGADHQLVTCDSYEQAISLLQDEQAWDVLLSDLMMPAEPHSLGQEGLRHLGHSIPIGLVLVLRAAQCGVKHLVCITDANHHDHPMSAALDWINSAYWNGEHEQVLQINSSRALIAHAPMDEGGKKNWLAALEVVLS